MAYFSVHHRGDVRAFSNLTIAVLLSFEFSCIVLCQQIHFTYRKNSANKTTYTKKIWTLPAHSALWYWVVWRLVDDWVVLGRIEGVLLFVAETHCHYSANMFSIVVVCDTSQTALLSCGVVIVILFTCRQTRSTVAYYIVVDLVAICISLPVLAVFYHRDFISWLAYYIYSDSVKVIQLILCIFYVCIFSLFFHFLVFFVDFVCIYMYNNLPLIGL